MTERAIALIGLSGAGKTTVGERLAERFNIPFSDTDAETAKRMGLAVPDAIDTHGITWFRGQEAQVVADSIESWQPGVISVAAGAVTVGRTYELVMDHCDCVWLIVDNETILQRLASSPMRRPLLDGDPAGHLARMRAKREPIYNSLSSIHVWAGDDISRVEDAIASALEWGGPVCCGASGQRAHFCSLTQLHAR